MKHLAFRLFGPFASWGDIAVGEHRPTLDGPTKSAVLGLVAAALGWRREDGDDRHRALDESLGMAVAVHDAGRWMRDYHTAMEPTRSSDALSCYSSRKEELGSPVEHYRKQGQPNWRFDKKALATDITQRDYRLDAMSTVFLWNRADARPDVPSLPVLQQELRKPAFVLYLGRKANPLALPMNPTVLDCGTLGEAIETAGRALPHEPFAEELFRNATVRYDIDHPAPGIVGTRSAHCRRDRIHSRDTRRWQFRDRRQYQQDWHAKDTTK